VRKDETAPDFTCRTTDGKPFTLSALKGKVVVLYFFDRLPMACMTEMKYIEKEIFQDLQKRDDFTILGIGRNLTREDVVKAGGDNKLTFPLAADPKQEIYARYFTKFVPRKIVVRKDGTIAHLSSGYEEYDGIVKLQAVLERLAGAALPLVYSRFGEQQLQATAVACRYVPHGVEPTVLRTGGKSLHIWVRVSDPIAAGDFTLASRAFFRLLQEAASDHQALEPQR
jgi:peroxiredoxin